MDRLSCHELLKVWETGQHQSLQDRVLTVLGFACPDKTRDQLGLLTLAQRDDFLFDLREKTFGPGLTGFAECPRCTERLEFKMATGDLRGRFSPGADRNDAVFEVPEEAVRLRFRSPNTADLVALAACGSAQDGRTQLLKQCIVEATREGAALDVQDLSAELIHRLSAAMLERQPQAEVLLDLTCPACSHHWQMIFDIAAFFWVEISAEARRLLREVHALASAYGWREEDILSMSHARRQAYLEMVTS